MGSQNCEYCKSYFNVRGDGKHSPYAPYGRLFSVKRIHVGATSGCWHCAALLDFLDKVNNQGSIAHFRSIDNSIGLFDSHIEEGSITEYDHAPNLETSVYRVTMEGTASEEAEYPDNTGIPCSSASDACLRWVQNRIDECASSHECWNPTGVEMPTRLLEIGEKDLHLRINAASAKYATLSHCWGTTNSTTVKLLKNNCHKLTTTGIAISHLNSTFGDAVDFTRRLGVKYIWIDSLCIIQDDADDWLHESSRMAGIYANSYIGLFAGHAQDGTGGLYGERFDPKLFHENCKVTVKDDTGRERIMSIERRNMIGHDITFLIQTGRQIPTIDARDLPGTKQPLYRRGWVFQELHLSPRAVLFNSQELIWVCNNKACCECDRTTEDDYATKYIFSKVPKVADYRSAMGTDLLWKHGMFNWAFLICAFSHLELTFEKDRLPALSGMAKAFQSSSSTEMKDDVYLAGLWKSMLPEALMWQTIDAPPNGPARRCRFRKPVRERGAPSWSWMSCDFTVQWHNFYIGDGCLVNVDAAHTEQPTLDRTGQVSRGHIVLQAVHLEEMAIVYPDDPMFRSAEYDLRDDYIRRSKTEQLVSKRDTSIKFSLLPDYDIFDKNLGDLFIPSTETLYCLPVFKLGGYWPFSEISLLLRRHSRGPEFSDTPAVSYIYERVGFCKGQIMFGNEEEAFKHHIVLV
ncbi:hypothetical protein FSARC_9495 [Fusarium sarcochroum]|uniref:Heterokaryon incompatibility domain-containing protein n=1 Tax=Fusarium sarcochroum TaxID=1208366 RepID=A0A8H4TR00_9HYPO|nr:hypothetical protein FSARC_9495 [Fusarium sarcochroum]